MLLFTIAEALASHQRDLMVVHNIVFSYVLSIFYFNSQLTFYTSVPVICATFIKLSILAYTGFEQ